MAHFTGLKALQNHPHRFGFDIGAKNVFSAKCGELLPVFCATSASAVSVFVSAFSLFVDAITFSTFALTKLKF